MKFEDMINTITLGDTYKLIKDIPDNSIDLIVIDPPYDFNMGGGGGSFGTKQRNYHNEYLSLNMVVDMVARIYHLMQEALKI